MPEPSPQPSSTSRRFARLFFVSISVVSLLLAVAVAVLWSRVRRGEFWNDLFLASRSGHCVMIRSSRTLPYSEELFTVVYESPWPVDIPFGWWSGDAIVQRHIGPARVGQVTIRRIADFGGVQITSWHGYRLGFWADGAPVFDASGYVAHHYSSPMSGWSFSMPHTYWMLLFLLPPLGIAYARARSPVSAQGRICPECACDLPHGASKCPDCGLAFGFPVVQQK